MTKQPESATATETGRHPEPIEITPEMIAAGESAFARFDSDFDPYAAGVEKVVRAVLEAGGYTVTGM